jgi:MFS family permease
MRPVFTSWRSVAVLTAAQSLFQTASILLVTLSGLIGLSLAPDRALATLPLSAMIVGGALVMVPASLLMQRWGRRRGFLLGTACGVVAGVLGGLSLVWHHFALFVWANGLVGAWQAFAQFHRFAAAEAAPEGQQSRAISWVMVGGVVAALAGPALAKSAQGLGEAWGPLYLPAFVIVSGLALIAAALTSSLRLPDELASPLASTPAPAPASASGPSLSAGALQAAAPPEPARPLLRIMAQPLFLAALTSSSVAFAVMVLVMTATPLAMQGCSLPLSAAALVIQAHVLGMFLPSFVTGSLIQRVGVLPIMGLGLVLMAAHVAVALSGIELWHFTTGLVLVGVGWNLLFIGASTLVTRTYTAPERAKTQAAHDFLMSAAAGVASLSSGALLQAWGWRGLNWSALPVLGLAALVLMGLAWQQARASGAAGAPGLH